jgi:hypothetical protein
VGNFVQSLGQAIAYIMAAYMSHWIILGINVALLIVGSITLWIGMSAQPKSPGSAKQVILAKVLSPKSHHR